MNKYPYPDELFDEPCKLIAYFLQDRKFYTESRFEASHIGKAGWIFRGQSDSKWDLTPSAFRPRNLDDFTHQPPTSNADRKKELVKHLHAEARAVFLFLENADRIGIPTPIDYITTNHALDVIFDALINENYDNVMQFPNVALQRAFALAQHHGVPTRFIDWSECPLVACFFAAFNASSFSEKSIAKNVTVHSPLGARASRPLKWRPRWPRSQEEAEGSERLPKNQEISIFYMSSLSTIIDSSPVQLVMTPWHENLHLRQQKGVFTNIKDANSFFLKEGRWPTLNDVPNLQLHRVRLPAVKADDLLRELYLLGITRQSLMPNLTNAANALKYMKVLFPKLNG